MSDFTRAIRSELILPKSIYNETSPDFKFGEGCLVDQLVGQFMAHLCGLGYLV